MKSILDPSFKYVHSSKTDIKKTFAKIYRLQKEEEARKDAEAEKRYAVISIRRKDESTR